MIVYTANIFQCTLHSAFGDAIILQIPPTPSFYICVHTTLSQHTTQTSTASPKIRLNHTTPWPPLEPRDHSQTHY